MARLTVDMKFPTHIHIHIHRFFVDIHGYIHFHRRLSLVHVAPKFLQNTAVLSRPPQKKTWHRHFFFEIVEKLIKVKNKHTFALKYTIVVK